MLSYTASAPLPEIGRINANGKHSGGKPKNSVTGDTIAVSTSSAPDALNTPTAVMSAISAGSI